MCVKMFAVDSSGNQIYECVREDKRSARKAAKQILKNMVDAVSVVGVEMGLDISNYQSASTINCKVSFLFMITKDLPKTAKSETASR